ncbi:MULTISPECIES: 30S ribosomal protein S20 [Domibacillus]|jgi:small subunit ribosomal protein S20|uniref:Small ribosomal subunit protein bS20 n=2 Tax=Domibacillus TaxID=1433999 RepID=A0A1E7DMM9_9BACI|nr:MULTISPECIES: 30S ribosomal protein S20 [Domibacillus]MCI2254480.1 30S ribosomal protein S20 [Domibacillus sp. PGB-M46]MCM3788486.1 30S ribosomal protein S20 [Domibacillus indicus]OES44314.1 30S ribosomal protein S20 [Domibacillus iocasae]OXS80462.1 30S ribosomal protein S20 [Domibacillus enclensis]WNS81903.1 30S ribosomal protein S20 [Domibacillus sp. DTU_2020_1001157_1_SI_ALB_TIR_016]
MPNIKSAIKRTKTAQIRSARNTQAKSAMRSAVKKFETAAANNDENAKELLVQAVSKLDKAAAKGLIHKNAANRQKSRLMKKLAN